MQYFFTLSAQALLDNKVVNLPSVSADKGALGIVLNLVWMLAGSLAVLFVVIGGFKYVTSNGDPGQIASAKNTILYALIGLVVAISAFMIVNFVLGRI